MVFRRRRMRGRRPMRGRRRRRFTRRRPMTAGRVMRIVGAELKFRDLSIAPIPMTTDTGIVIQISDISQGDTATQREGNWIKPTTWMGTFTVQGNPAAEAVTTAQFRIICVVWKENENVDSITLGKVVQDTFAPHQQFNIQSKGSFKVLWSRVGLVSNDIDNPQFQKMLRFYVKPRMKILFDAADFRKYHLFILALSDVNAESNPPSLSFDTRLRFTDS